MENAVKRGLDLSRLQGLALSHGHYDHTDGLVPLLTEATFRGPIFTHPSFSVVRYKIKQGSAPEGAGMNLEPLRQRSLPFNPVSVCCDL